MKQKEDIKIMKKMYTCTKKIWMIIRKKRTSKMRKGERKISEKNLDNNTKKNTKTTKSVKTKILEKILAIIQKNRKRKASTEGN